MSYLVLLGVISGFQSSLGTMAPKIVFVDGRLYYNHYILLLVDNEISFVIVLKLKFSVASKRYQGY